MDDSVKSNARLEVSVSFGRFENDGLSWEKFSSFSPNKYLEEAGHLSTPGSVAQKKAYFEAHYKKIAAMKADEMEQEKSAGPVILSPNAANKKDCFENSSAFETIEECVNATSNVSISNSFNKDGCFEDSSEPNIMLGLSNGENTIEECVTAKPNASNNEDCYENSSAFETIEECVTATSNVSISNAFNEEGCFDNSSEPSFILGLSNGENTVEECVTAKLNASNNEDCFENSPAFETIEECVTATSIVSILNAFNEEGCFENSSEPIIIPGLSNGENIVEECATEKPKISISNENRNDNDQSSEKNLQKSCYTDGLMDEDDSHEEKKDIIVVVKCESLKAEEAQHDSKVKGVDEIEINIGKNFGPVELKTPLKVSRDVVGKRYATKKEASVLKKERSKSSTQNTIQKVTPIKNEQTLTVAKKKIVSPSPITKPLEPAASRYSRLASMMTTPKSTSRSLNKKTSEPRIPKINDFPVEKSERGGPISLHMSLSLGPTHSSGGIAITRKSLIMERMGDKDIVKRAFKTFQNRANGSLAADEKPILVSSSAVEPKVMHFHTPTKGNIGLENDTEKMVTPGSRPRTKSNPLLSGSRKSSSLGSKNTAGLKNDEKSDMRKQFLKKLEAKAIARVAANAHLSAKSKMAVANEIDRHPTLTLQLQSTPPM